MRWLAMVALAVMVAAVPARGQTTLDIGPRFVRLGAPVEWAERRVRFGENHANAAALGFRVGVDWVQGDVWMTWTDVVADTGSGPNPAPGAIYRPVWLMGASVGPRIAFGAASAGVAVGGLILTCSYRHCGSSPMVNPTLGASVDVCSPTELRFCMLADLTGATPRRGRWSWLADLADPDRPDNDDHGRRWFWVLQLGWSFGVVW